MSIDSEAAAVPLEEGAPDRASCVVRGAQAHVERAHIELTCLMNVYFDGADASALFERLAAYAALPREIVDRVQFVIVDDGSPTRFEVPSSVDLNLLVLRIREDIAWNQPGARNLGVVYARSDKVLMTDLDHEFNRATFEHALAAKNPGRTIYKLRRVMGDGAGHHPHPNTFFLSRARFLRFHGYDEEFAGHYGFDDSMFWRWQRYHGTRFRMLPRRCHIQHRGTVRDEDYKSIRRDLAHNRVLATQKREAWRRVGPAAGHSRRFLAFTWDIAEDRVRSTRPPSPPPRPLWVKTWWWRWLLG